MKYQDKELLFISNLQTKIGNEVLELDKTRYNFNSKEFTLIDEMSLMLDFWANTRYNYVNSGGQQVPYHRCNLEEDKLTRYIDFLRHRYRMGNIPFISYPNRVNKLEFSYCCDTFSLPDGGGPGEYLTKDASGNLRWEKINDCLFKQTFISPSVNESLAPYNFVLNNFPEAIHQVFINGKLIVNENLYELTGNILTIKAPFVLDNAIVSVFSGCSNVIDGIGGANQEVEEFVWNVGDSNTFLLSNLIYKVNDVEINGLDVSVLQDIAYTPFTNEVLLLDELEDGDFIIIKYNVSNFLPPISSGIFDETFDETFE